MLTLYKIERQQYLTALETCCLTVGDYVKVVRGVRQTTCGWCGMWKKPDMDSAIGKIFKITKKEKNGYVLYGLEKFEFPYFVLEKVPHPQELDEANEWGPFTRVLRRDHTYCTWEIDLFSYFDSGRTKYPYHCMGGAYAYCIPYAGNEHLLGTCTGGVK